MTEDGNRRPHLMVVAGEMSGDMHAAHVVEELHSLVPGIRISGIGGDRLRERGAELHYDVQDMAVIGISEVIRRYGFFRRVFHDMVARAERERPDAVLLIDYPGFNLRFAEKLHRLGIKVLYYVCPQVWAWHRSRIPKMAGILDRLMVIFPFEVDVFAGTDLKVDFVGHPLVDECRTMMEAEDMDLPWQGSPKVAILPGSRRQELERLMPVLLEAACRVEKQVPGVSFLLPAASSRTREQAEAAIAAAPCVPKRLTLVEGLTRHVLKQADAAWIKSGTSTLEGALMNCPMVVMYKTAAMTYWLGRRLVKVPYIGMVNLIAERELCRELIQHDASPEKLADEILPLLSDTPERNAMLEGLAEVRHRLGDGGAAARVARIIADELGASAQS